MLSQIIIDLNIIRGDSYVKFVICKRIACSDSD
jgi:hypothetical protein